MCQGLRVVPLGVYPISSSAGTCTCPSPVHFSFQRHHEAPSPTLHRRGVTCAAIVPFSSRDCPSVPPVRHCKHRTIDCVDSSHAHQLKVSLKESRLPLPTSPRCRVGVNQRCAHRVAATSIAFVRILSALSSSGDRETPTGVSSTALCNVTGVPATPK